MRAIVENKYMVTMNWTELEITLSLHYITVYITKSFGGIYRIIYIYIYIYNLVFEIQFHTSIYVNRFGIPTTHNFHNLTKDACL